MKNLRIVVQFSGGKDSQACLLCAKNVYGAERIEAVFCDTGWEHPDTIKHVYDVCEQAGVRLTVLRAFIDFKELCLRLKMFPLPKRRICTSQLKINPTVDWILRSDDNFLMLQGIRAGESASRAKMAAECSYFKEYFDGKAHYRRLDVLEWCKTHDASILRPIFAWSAQQVIDYILANGQQPNPLYRRGASRVGCFPCIMARHGDIRVVANDKAMRQRLIDLENEVSALRTRPGKSNQHACFFMKGTIPERYCKAIGGGHPTAEEVFDYVTRDDAEPDLFRPAEGYSCMSMYHGLCE